MPPAAPLTPFLAPGMHVRVVAPASPFDPDELERGIERLRRRYRVTHAASLLARSGYLAGDDARRSGELLDALSDPSVDAIFCARGGYGATRLLDTLEPAQVRARPRLLVGFSDITALHALWWRAGVASVHGPMVAALGRGDEGQLERVIATVEGRAKLSLSGLHALHPGRARGRLMGGNLTVLCALLGTPFMPDLRGAILLLEDVGERPYRLDRMLTSLRQSGAIGQVAGILLGAFTGATVGSDGVCADDVLRERLAGLGVPVLGGAPIGHVDDNLPVVLGEPVELDAAAGTARAVPT